MREPCSKRFLINCVAAMAVAGCFSQPARAVLIQFVSPYATIPNLPVGPPGVPVITTLMFGPANYVDDKDWGISGGRVILTVVPGPMVNGMPTTASASLVLTGLQPGQGACPAAGPACPFTITYEAPMIVNGVQMGNGNNSVAITFDSGDLINNAFVPGFAPINSAFDSAELDGSVVGAALAQRNGVELTAIATGPNTVPPGGLFGILPFPPALDPRGPGAFGPFNKGPVADLAPRSLTSSVSSSSNLAERAPHRCNFPAVRWSSPPQRPNREPLGCWLPVSPLWPVTAGCVHRPQ